jgi:hypothetical protein
MIRYGVPGPLTIHRDEQENPLGAAMLRRLLAVVVAAGEQFHRYNTARSYTHLGDAHLARGDRRAATGYWRQAMDILHSLKHPDADPLAERLKP